MEPRMYVLIKVDVDHENESFVSLLAASDDVDELNTMMEEEWLYEMEHPSCPHGWDEEFSEIGFMSAVCEVETCEWSIRWNIFNTNSTPCWISFI